MNRKIRRNYIQTPYTIVKMYLTFHCAEILHSIYQYRQNMWSLKDKKKAQRREERPRCFDPRKGKNIHT